MIVYEYLLTQMLSCDKIIRVMLVLYASIPLFDKLLQFCR